MTGVCQRFEMNKSERQTGLTWVNVFSLTPQWEKETINEGIEMEEEGTETVWRRTEIESNSAEQDLDSRLLADLVYLFILIFKKIY